MDHICTNCQAHFEIFDEDMQFLQKISPTIKGRTFTIPPPTHCPSCREQRRTALRNERHLSWRTCDKTGQKILSIYHKDTLYTVYEDAEWWKDDWDPMSYGRDVDFSRPFFDQYKELLDSVPKMSIRRGSTSENCEYCTMGFSSKNCYMGFTLVYCEDVYYSTRCYTSKNCVDCFISGDSELLYECVGCDHCYACVYCHDSSQCRDSFFLANCRQCSNCICCKNMVGKSYHIYNEPVSKKAYEDFVAKLHTEGLTSEYEKFAQWRLQFPNRSTLLIQSENCTGEYLRGAQNCHDCFEFIGGGQDARYTQFSGFGCKDVMDCTMIGVNSQLVYETHGSIEVQQGAFLNHVMGNNLYYCDSMQNNCSHCFGCVGLKKASYCIFNKQYTKDAYEELVSRIIKHMQSTGEWGEFFPITISPFAYNETLAHDFYPLTKEEVEQKGWRWRTEEISMPNVEKVIPSAKLPSSIDAIPDDVLQWAIACKNTGKLFKIIQQELDFYRRMHIPIPALHPEERHKRRLSLRNPHRLWKRQCDKCAQDMQTSYAPDRPEIVYCEQCYLQELY